MQYGEYLNSLTKGEKRFLSKYGCAWCDHSLHRDGCGDTYSGDCGDANRIKRAKECLKGYKPRKREIIALQ